MSRTHVRQYLRDPFPPADRWEVYAQRAFREWLATGEYNFSPSVRLDIRDVYHPRRAKTIDWPAGTNLEHLSRAMAGFIGVEGAGETLAQSYRDMRLPHVPDPENRVGVGRIEALSTGYAPIQYNAALAGLTGRIGDRARSESRHILRRRIAWYALHYSPHHHEVLAPCGRIYERDDGVQAIHPLHATVTQAVADVGIRPRRERLWNWMTPMAAFGGAEPDLIPALFTERERKAFSDWISGDPELAERSAPTMARLISEMYTPDLPGRPMAWELRRYDDGSYAAWWTRLASYGAGRNGALPAVVATETGALRWVYGDGATAHVVESPNGSRIEVYEDANRNLPIGVFDLPRRQVIARIAMDHLGVILDGARISPAPLPELPDWTPAHPGFEGEDRVSDPAPPPEPQPDPLPDHEDIRWHHVILHPWRTLVLIKRTAQAAQTGKWTGVRRELARWWKGAA